MIHPVWHFAWCTLHYFANKGPSSPSYGFSSSHVQMWELDYKESWTLQKWCFWTVVLERFLSTPNLKAEFTRGKKKFFFHFQISILLFWLLYSKGNYYFKTDHLKLCICACVCAHICWLGGWLIGWRDLLHKKGLQHISNIWFILLEGSQYISNFLLMITVDGRMWGNNTFWF